jgi:hypothetical protein
LMLVVVFYPAHKRVETELPQARLDTGHGL